MTLRNLSLALVAVVVLSPTGPDAFARAADDSPASSDDQTLLKVPARATLTADQWKAFGMQLTAAMASENRGVQIAALRLAAYHGDQLQLGRQASINAVRVYRDHPDQNVRKLAVVAIARMNHSWGIDFLERSVNYEKSAGVARVMRSALRELDLEN